MLLRILYSEETCTICVITDRMSGRPHTPSVDDNGLKDESCGSHEKLRGNENCFQHFILSSKAQLTCALVGFTMASLTRSSTRKIYICSIMEMHWPYEFT